MGRTLNRSMIRVVLAVAIAAIAVQAALPVQPELASSSSSSALSSSSSNAVLSSSSSAGLTALVMKPLKCYSAHKTTPLKVDGIMGHHTTENLQSFLNMMGTGQKLTLDGDFGQASNKVLKKYLK